MRNYLVILVALFLWSCEWEPERILTLSETRFQSVNLALGDTATVSILGKDMAIEEVSTPDIVEIVIQQDNSIQLIAIDTGKTTLAIKYEILLIDDSGEDAQAVLYLDIAVSDGIPLSLMLHEATTLFLEDYLSGQQLENVDSISVGISDSLSENELTYTIDSLSVTLKSNTPGTQRLEIITFDSSGLQISSLVFQAQTTIRRGVLAELFTNAGCVNCPIANENLDRLYEHYPENFTAIRYHVFWTDPDDPMNLYNQDEVEDRRVYYGSSWEAPRLFIQGNVNTNYDDYQSLTNALEQSINSGTDIHIGKPDIVTSLDSVFLDVKIQNFSSSVDPMICWSVLTEDSIYYVGTNGEVNHMQVMRDMTSTSITQLDTELDLSQSLKLTPDYELSENYHIVTFLQNSSTKEIIQAVDYSMVELTQ